MTRSEIQCDTDGCSARIVEPRDISRQEAADMARGAGWRVMVGASRDYHHCSVHGFAQESVGRLARGTDAPEAGRALLDEPIASGAMPNPHASTCRNASCAFLEHAWTGCVLADFQGSEEPTQ